MDQNYKTQSSTDGGTLYQLKCLINRKNVCEKVTKDYHADASFVDLVLDCHVVSAAMTYFNLDSVDGKPDNAPDRIEIMSKEKKTLWLKQMVRDMVDKFMVNVMTEVVADIAEEGQPQQNQEDGVYNYATGFMKFGLIRRVSVVATASGDGERALRHWRYALLAYHQRRKTKYRLEAFLLTASVRALLPERFAQEVT